MKRTINFVINKLLGANLEFRVRLFNVLAMAGSIIGFLMIILGVVTNAGILNVVANAVSMVLAISLLYYSYRSGRYQFCYMITVIVIFLLLFPVLFFSTGGYHSGMPSFFVFAVLFTIFMLEGKAAFIFSAIELAVYLTICVIAKYFPETVNWYASDDEVFIDVITAFIVVSLSLGLTMFIHFRIYNSEQVDLKNAKDEALRFSEAKSSFLANMSHEIRTPINVMLGMNEVILRETGSERIKGYSRSVENAGRQLMTLINNILDVSTIEKGIFEVTEEHYETASLIAALTTVGEDCAKRHSLSFKTNVDETLPCVLMGDMTHIQQIVSNFLSNAAKYTEKGGMTLSFSARSPQVGEYTDEIILRVSVADTGMGIKQENIPYLFDAFARGKIQSHRYIEGSGLGLAIVKEYAKRMGGRVHVQSELGKGSVFAVEIAQKVCDTTPIGQWEHPGAARQPDEFTGGFTAPGCNLLIVDDNRENLQVIKSLLAYTLMRTDTAGSGAECLDAAKRIHYDVILMDYMMPGMDGVETLRRLKEIPGFNTPVIALTANVIAGVREKLLDAGFSEYLSKPVICRDLEAALLASLPTESFAMSAAAPAEIIPAGTKDELANDLLAYGITLDSGLRYVSGDIVRYGRSASFFTENYETSANEIRGLADQCDWSGMKFRVHSLKSNARNLGALALADTAAKLELLCASGDGMYITAALPVMYLEWERARNGLAAFITRLDAVLPKPEKQTLLPVSFDKLMRLLKVNQYSNSMDSLNGLIESEKEADVHPERLETLRTIRQKVENIDFRKAERLLNELIESEAGGNES